MRMKGASGCRQTVMQDPGAQHPVQMFLTGARVDFGEGGKPEYPEKNSHVRLRSTETNPTYDTRGGRRNRRIQRQLDFPKINLSPHTIAEVGGANVDLYGLQWHKTKL